MSDLSITSSSVVPQSNAVVVRGTAGATITAGQLVYMDASASNQLKPARQSSATTASVVGIAVNAASVGQPVEYVTSGDVTMTTTGAGTTIVTGTVYVLGSDTTPYGTISPADDLHSTSGRYGTIVGISTSTTNLRVAITPSGVVNP